MTAPTPTRALGLPDCESEVGPGTAVALRMMPRWRPSEDEIVRAAITVILVALGTIIALAAMAILTMG